MRIVILNRWFSERMGYADASLAHEYSMAGHEVFLVTSNAQPYFDSPDYCDIYEKFNGPPLTECCWKPHDNYTLIRLPICAWPYKYSFRNLSATLKKIKPDIVQTFDLLAPYNIQAALFCKFHKACFFSGNHVVNSVFSPARGGMSLLRRIKWNYWMPWIGGIFYRNFCEKNYAATIDGFEINRRFFGVPDTCNVLCELGVDTRSFYPDPVAGAAKRRELGVTDSELLVLYSGRFNEGKNPFVLAEAVRIARQRGLNCRGFFIGNGSEEAIRHLAGVEGCTVLPFVESSKLPDFYRAADIAVWPRQESTSMLDAAATGTPIVVSDRVLAHERYEGNGLTYRENDPVSLAEALQTLADPELRRTLGEHGTEKMLTRFSWKAIAVRRLQDYGESLARRR